MTLETECGLYLSPLRRARNGFLCASSLRRTVAYILCCANCKLHVGGSTPQTYQEKSLRGGRFEKVVRLRGPSAKHFWEGLEELGSRLEELGVGDEEVKNV